MAEIDGLVTNKWEFYDVKKMRRLKAALIIPLLFLVWFLIVFIVWLIASLVDYSNLQVILIIGTVSTVIVMLFVSIKIKQMNRDKKDWYFAAFQDSRLNREWFYAMLTDFLRRNGYMFTETSTHRTITLWITYFDIAGTDFKVRLYYTLIAGMPVVEIGIGPENMINRNRIEELRTRMSAEIAAAFLPPVTAPPAAPIPQTIGKGP
jgi:hypothetical protein